MSAKDLVVQSVSDFVELKRPRSEYPKIFVNIPVMNEEENIDTLLHQVREELAGLDYMICLVDDGSKDGTIDIVRRHIAEAPDRIHLIAREKTISGCQRGGALYTAMNWGLRNGDYQIFIEMDGDMSHRPEELIAGIAQIADEGNDVAIASKYLPQSAVIKRSIGRMAVSKVCSIAVQILLSPHVVDYSNGYRFYNRRAAEIVANHLIKYTSPIYLSEALSIWMRSGLRVAEFPSVYIGRYEGVSKLQWFDLMKGALAMFEISVRFHLIGFRKRTGDPAAIVGRHEPVEA